MPRTRLQLLPTNNVRAKILGEAIPATSRAAGRNEIPNFSSGGRNVDMMEMKRTLLPQWPAGRALDINWRHGDFKVVAYPFIFPLYDDLVLKGRLDI